MRTICMYFQVHQPFRFRRYRFFDIGNEHYYYDDFSNESILRKVAEKSYLPANRRLLKMIKKHGTKFKVAFSISGIAVEQFRMYAPEVLESFRELAATGQVEFLAETYAHSLVSMHNREEFIQQVNDHRAMVREVFGQEPTVFRNTELAYSDEIGSTVYHMGFKAMLTEGAKHVLGWKSPNYLYCNALEPRLKVLLKNYKLSDDIAFRFGNTSWPEYPLTSEKFVGWLNQLPPAEETVNLFMDYETFGEHQWKETGIFDFLEALPEAVFRNSRFTFSTPSEVADSLQVISAVNVPNPISWADEERDLTAWLGNEMQQEAFHKLYDLRDKVYLSKNPELMQDFKYLQVSDHFYYMSTKFFSDGEVHSYFNPYNTPYEAFINYMNILSDFEIRVNAEVSTSVDEDVVRLSKIIQEKDELIRKYEERLSRRKVAAGTKTAVKKQPLTTSSRGTTAKRGRASGSSSGKPTSSSVQVTPPGKVRDPKKTEGSTKGGAAQKSPGKSKSSGNDNSSGKSRKAAPGEKKGGKKS